MRRYRGKVRKELVPIPEMPDDSGEPLVVEVRSLLGHARADYMDAIAGEPTPDGTARRVNWHEVLPLLPYLSTYDPDTDEMMFDNPEDVMTYDSGAIERINQVAQRLSGITQEEEKEAGKS